MKMRLLGVLLIPAVLAFGQGTRPPADVDQALRARVAQFYQAYMDGKFRQAYQLVSDDSQDAFMQSTKGQYKSCETVKIDFSDDFATATVLETCVGEMPLHGSRLPAKVPISSHWRVENGNWNWYYVRPAGFETPAGISTATESDVKKPIIPDIQALASQIMGSVKLDKPGVALHSWETSKDEIHVRNEMPGTVDLKLDIPNQPGLKVHADKTTLGPNEEATIIFEYKVDDAEVLCGDCAKKVHGTAIVQVRIEPIGKVFPINVVFELPPTSQK